MKSLLKFARLNSSEKFFFINALFLMGYYRLVLKRKPLQKLLQEIKEKAEAKLLIADNSIPLPRAANLAAKAGSMIPFSTCLSKTIAGHVLLAHKGYKTKIHIGVCKNIEAGFEAHAWLTHKNSIVLGSLPDLQKYKELPF